MSKLKLIAAFGSVLYLSGCASLSGYDAAGDFSCKAQPGVSCQSISGVYQNAKKNNLPSQKQKNDPDYLVNKPEEEVVASDDLLDIEDDYTEQSGSQQDFTMLPLRKTVTGQTASTGAPVFIPPQQIRVWMAPYEDENQVLHDQSYSYLVIQKARWGIEHYKELQKRQSQFSINHKIEK